MARTVKRTVLLWDIANWTAHTKSIGLSNASKFTNQMKWIIDSICANNRGVPQNETGDGGYLFFESSVDAINAAVSSLQYLSQYSKKYNSAAKIRILIASSEVRIEDDGRCIGDSMTLAARLGGVTQPFELSMDTDSYSYLHSNSKDIVHLTKLKVGEFKGLGDVSYYQFDWNAYAFIRPADTLDGIVRALLNSANITLSTQNIRLLDQGDIYWPVVPRKSLTAIHRAQIEVLKLFDFLGWNIHIFLVDYGSVDASNKDYVEAFRKHILSYFTRRKFNPSVSFNQLSSFIAPHGAVCCDLRSLIERMMGRMKYAALVQLNTKSYITSHREEINSDPIARHMRPLYTIAALMHMLSSTKSISLVLSGADESSYWDQMVNDDGCTQPYVTIPILRGDKVNQAIQTDNYPTWTSIHAFSDSITSAQNDNEQNLVEWIHNVFVTLPSLIVDDYSSSTEQVRNYDIGRKSFVDDLSRLVFPILDSAK